MMIFYRNYFEQIERILLPCNRKLVLYSIVLQNYVAQFYNKINEYKALNGGYLFKMECFRCVTWHGTLANHQEVGEEESSFQ